MSDGKRYENDGYDGPSPAEVQAKDREWTDHWRARTRSLEQALSDLLEAVGWPQETDEDCAFVDERVDAARAALRGERDEHHAV